MHYMHETPNKHVPAKTAQGWGIAVLVWVLTAACVASVFMIHQKTYKHPTDVRWHSVSQQHAATAEH